MGCGTLTKTIYVKQTIPPLPDKPEYYSVPFDEGYCLSEQGAKNMLKNKALLDDYVRQLEEILQGLN